MNILWRHKNGAMAVTHIVDDHHETPEEHAQTLLKNGDIPKDFVPVGYAVPDLPHHMPIEIWDHQNGKVTMHLAKARAWHKERLRIERAPVLQDLDVKSLRNQENGVDNAPTLKAKQVLRDITRKVDDETDWHDMAAITVPKELPK